MVLEYPEPFPTASDSSSNSKYGCSFLHNLPKHSLYGQPGFGSKRPLCRKSELNADYSPICFAPEICLLFASLWKNTQLNAAAQFCPSFHFWSREAGLAQETHRGQHQEELPAKTVIQPLKPHAAETGNEDLCKQSWVSTKVVQRNRLTK